MIEPPAMSRINFVIVAQPRSGSTALRRSLHRPGHSWCCGEVFALNHVRGLGPIPFPDVEDILEYRNEAPDRFLTEIFERGQTPRTGVKILTFQLLNVPFASALRLVTFDESIRILMLSRRDLVRRYLSELKFKVSARPAKGRQPVELEVDPRQMEADCRAAEDLRHVLHKLLKRRHFVEVFYEDLVAKRPDTLAAISDLLEFDAPFPGLIEQNTDASRTTQVIIRNEAEILSRASVANS